jgi:hypothetical protein
MMKVKDDEVDILERIRAMRLQEVKTTRCKNYLTPEVDASCRKAMVDWCFVICDILGLSRETVGIAFSILDRYLSSDNGKLSSEALRNKQTFQLAATTCLFVAVKLHEPALLGIDILIKLCRGYYTEKNILAMEKDILESLEYRIYLTISAPMEYVRHFLELLGSEFADVSDVIHENALKYLDSATSDIYFSTCRSSAIGVACLAGALNDTWSLSSLEKDAMWRQLSRKLDFDIASKEIRKVELQLLAESDTTCEPKRESQTRLPRTSVNKARERDASPVSVTDLLAPRGLRFPQLVRQVA